MPIELVKEKKQNNNLELVEHFFRNEYGGMVSFVTRYLGVNNVENAEDIVQETLLKAVSHWQNNGIPENPKGWLYLTAKNLTLNVLKRRQHKAKYEKQGRIIGSETIDLVKMEITEKAILDDQLKMMFVCCHSSISEHQQIALILKILCGFSLSEIASSFFSNKETINKRLVRARKELRKNNVQFELPEDVNEFVPIIQKALYLLFTEGYKPSRQNKIIRRDICFESIRLAEILLKSEKIEKKGDLYGLLSLMYLNVSRFEARMNNKGVIVEMGEQDRTKWNQNLINKGLQYLKKSVEDGEVSIYHILAAISANHCVASAYEKTNWKEILSLYDSLIKFKKSPMIKLNRSVALSKVKGNRVAILELQKLESRTDIGSNALFHSTLGKLHQLEKENREALKRYEKAIVLSENELDKFFLKKKIKELVPI